MDQFILLLMGFLVLVLGVVLGYFTRQTIAQKQADTIEAKIQKRIVQAQKEVSFLLSEAKQKASQMVEQAKKIEEKKRSELLKTERLLLKREDILNTRFINFEKKEQDLETRLEKIKEIKKTLEQSKEEILLKLEKISGFSKEEAKKELLERVEKENQKEILEKMKKLESESESRFEKRAKEILTLAIQKTAISQAQEITTTNVILPNEEIKGKIIGREGRNIRAFEKATGVELIIDETPEMAVISGFDPTRRYIAKIALERLIKDGRIQPSRIEEIVQKVQSEINEQIKEAGEEAVYETGIIGLDPKLIQLLGRLRFRTSYGQNVLLHSLEVAFLAEAISAELRVNSKIAKKAGLLHDIGKALSHQIEGSHTDIGIKILEKFGVEPEVITAMKSHHEEYPYENLEAIIIQTADAISGARPGARKDTLENYLKRLGDLENIANAFPGVEKSYALQAGREIRIFVNPEQIDDLNAKKLARDIADRIEEELKFPGEIKIILIRENRIIEYAR